MFFFNSAKRARLSSSDSVDEPGKDTKETQDKHSEQSSRNLFTFTPKKYVFGPWNVWNGNGFQFIFTNNGSCPENGF